MKIEAIRPLHIRRAVGDLHLRPGVPVELPDAEAVKLLDKGKVRVAPTPRIEQAIKPDGLALTPVYWQRHDQVVGPGVPEFVLKDGDAFWIAVEFQ